MADKMDAVTAFMRAAWGAQYGNKEAAERRLKRLAELGYHLTPIAPVQEGRAPEGFGCPQCRSTNYITHADAPDRWHTSCLSCGHNGPNAPSREAAFSSGGLLRLPTPEPGSE